MFAQAFLLFISRKFKINILTINCLNKFTYFYAAHDKY